MDLSGDDHIWVVHFSSVSFLQCFVLFFSGLRMENVYCWSLFTFSLGLKLALLGYGVCALGQNICTQIFVL